MNQMVLFMTERTYWQTLRKIGWLKCVSKSQQQKIRDSLKKTRGANPEWAYLCLNQTAFDTECIDEPGSYRRVLKSLARDSNGLFCPTHIKEEDVTLGKRRYAIKVSFRHDGESFSVTVPHEGDHFEMSVLDLVNEALETSGIRERFVELPPVDQCAFLALIPPEIYDKAVAQKLIPARRSP